MRCCGYKHGVLPKAKGPKKKYRKKERKTKKGRKREKSGGDKNYESRAQQVCFY